MQQRDPQPSQATENINIIKKTSHGHFNEDLICKGIATMDNGSYFFARWYVKFNGKKMIHIATLCISGK